MSSLNLIKNQESEVLEFKKSLRLKDEIGEAISAFSNTKGGTLIVGVDDDGNKIIGVEIGKNTIESLANYIKQHTDPQVFPQVRAESVEDKEIIIIEIPESQEKPVLFKGRAYKRVGKSRHRISSAEIRKLALESKKIYWDERVCDDATLEDIDEEKVRWYLEERENARNISKEIRISIKQLLQNIKALEGDKPTNSSILFFGKYPPKFLPNARLRVVRFKGTKVIHPTLDTANCEGTIWEMVSTSEDFIRKNIRLLGTRTEKSFRREDKFEYPIKALKEAIVNALIHRNYLETGDVRVFIFDNRIEIINPGSFPEGVTPENPLHKPVNEVLCQLVYDIGFIEKYGSGIYMMKDLSRKWGNKEPFYDLHPIETKIIFESPIKESTYIEIDEFEGLNERQRSMMRFLYRYGQFTRKEYASHTKISLRQANKDINDLLEKGRINKHGKGRGVYYSLP